MLSREEKREMLEDGRNKRRGKDLEAAKNIKQSARSFDIYMSFLGSVQKIFSPFKVSRSHSITKFNKL